jgi:hypothetical protein
MTDLRLKLASTQPALKLRISQPSLKARVLPGIPGDDGTNATIAVGTVTTLSTGSPATVVNVGTSSAAIFDFGIPQGAPGGVTPSALTSVNDTNVTLTLGGTPATALLQAASLTLGWSGRLALSRLATGTAGYMLQGNGASDSVYAGFLQAGTGAITRTWQDKAREAVSVTDFGAVGDDATDNTTAFNNAISAAAGRIVFIPAGTYRITSLNAPAAGTVIVGESRQSAIIKTTSATATVLPISNAFVSIEDIQIQSSVTRSANWYIDVSASEFSLRNFDFVAPFEGIRLRDGISTVTITDGIIRSAVATSGVSIRIGSGTGLGPLVVSLRRLICTNPSGAKPFAHLYLENTGDLSAYDVQLILGGVNLYIAPGSGQTVVSAKFVGCWFDQAGNQNFVTALTGTGNWQRSSFTSCWFGTPGNANASLVTSGSTVIDGISFTDCDFFGGTGGLSAVGAGIANLQFIGNRVAGANGTGVNLDAVAGARVLGNRIGSNSGFGVNTLGVNLVNGADNIAVEGNDLRSNTTVLTNTATGVNNRIERNRGYNPVGVSSPTPGASPWTYTAGASPETIYPRASTNITQISVGGTNLLAANIAAGIPATVRLEPNEAAVITYTGTLTMPRFIH